MENVLITGGAGYIGSVLARYLAAKGYPVTVLDRGFFGLAPVSPLTEQCQCRVIKEDIRHFDGRLLAGIDVVMDLAGLANDPSCDLDPQLTQSINAEGCSRVALLAKSQGVKRYIQSSSCSVYGHGAMLNLTEASPTNPVSTYAKSKRSAEVQALNLADDKFSVTILRNATVYGLSPKMRFDLIINVMTFYAYKHRKIYVLGGGKQWRPVVHVLDVCRAFEAVMQAPQSAVNHEIYNVGSTDQNYQVDQLASMVCTAIPGTVLECIPDDPDKRTYHVNFDKLATRLGYRAIKKPLDGIMEIYDALLQGVVDTSMKTKTVEYYKFLIEAEAILREVLYQGKLF